MPAESLCFDHVSKRFGDTSAVEDVCVDIPAGTFVALVGASGSGKSTLLQTINRLVEPDAGRVLIDGVDVASGSAPALRRRIGYVFQGIGLFPHLSVAQNIAIGPRIAGQAAADVGALLDLVALPRAVATRMPHALSGGQRQRVAIARALAPGAKLLLLDEAFGALDPVTRDALGQEIRGLHDRLGLTTILVTHDMAEALLLADRVLVMHAGRIVADETPAALLHGAGGDAAQALVAVPRDQASRLAALDA
ncbi:MULTISPECIES: ATP-binding cassette domain-containing protein [unclassified Sphingomonas]|jgi:osmoprotectant transport system ATP-binding protein|uniref:ATP-binding cassette domain-containing protein n=1 Tax=unclassified Sphingomonas TaxID=196159 RepID=UPI000E108B60|nr:MULTISPECIES: ATP-binding cassette domain-containing protein [unclassified Sphingomonas]AXJ95017.1 ABC transporter ATP-binding protein [Sphingomonas sp. FARSPH]